MLLYQLLISSVFAFKYATFGFCICNRKILSSILQLSARESYFTDQEFHFMNRPGIAGGPNS